MSLTTPWIWHRKNWPKLTFDASALAGDLSHAYGAHANMVAKALSIGLTDAREIALEATASEALATAAIEGERLDLTAVRSSVLRKLGLPSTGPVDRHVDGLIELLHDATTRTDVPLDKERLCGWQASLFPRGFSGVHRITAGAWRTHEYPMQIVSGIPGGETVHYQAPPSAEVPDHMAQFLEWFDRTTPRPACSIDGLARAAVAHLWFESIHPFEDGNGRVGRAIVDFAVAQHLHDPLRLYSLSHQLARSRGAYHDALNAASRGDVDVTTWVQWFIRQCTAAYDAASETIAQALLKRDFWQQAAAADVNDRQRKVLRRLLDAGDGGFLGGMTAAKYMKMTGASKATATRDLVDLEERGLVLSAGGGRSVHYSVAVSGWAHGLVR